MSWRIDCLVINKALSKRSKVNMPSKLEKQWFAVQKRFKPGIQKHKCFVYWDLHYMLVSQMYLWLVSFSASTLHFFIIQNSFKASWLSSALDCIPFDLSWKSTIMQFRKKINWKIMHTMWGWPLYKSTSTGCWGIGFVTEGKLIECWIK